MPDVLLRQLWLGAIVVRGLALAICWKRVPRTWILWAAFSEICAFVLRGCDYQGCGWYNEAWIVEQLGNVALLAFLTRATAFPTAMGVYLSVACSTMCVIWLHITHHFANPLLAPVIEVCGAGLLALGLIAVIGALARPKAEQWVLSGYLILSSLLMLVAPDYLSAPGLGRAWSLLEIGAFVAWIVVFRFSGRLSA